MVLVLAPMQHAFATDDAAACAAKIKSRWTDVEKAVRSKDSPAISELLDELNLLRLRSGFINLKEYSLDLIRFGQAALAAGDTVQAGFFYRKAIELSPTSIDVRMRGLLLGSKTRSASMPRELWTVIKLLPQSPASVGWLIAHCTYPIIVSLMLGAYLTLALIFSIHIPFLSRDVDRAFAFLPGRIVKSVCLLAVLLVPCFLGPLWCLTLWATAIVILLPQLKRLAACIMAFVIATALAVPIRENVALWLENDGVQALLSSVASELEPGQVNLVEAFAKWMPQAPEVQYIYAQTLKNHGQLDEAEKVLNAVSPQMNQELAAYADAQRGSIEYLRGNLEKADQYFAAANLSSGAFLYSFARIKFDLLDPAAGRLLFEKARAADSDLVARLEEREENIGAQYSASLAEIDLPLLSVLKVFLSPHPYLVERTDAVMRIVMPGSTPFTTVLVGAGVMLLLLLFGKTPRRGRWLPPSVRTLMTSPVGALIHAIPGGSWVAAGRSLIAAIVTSLVVLLGAPLVVWSKDSVLLYQIFPGFYAIHVTAWMLCLLVVYMSGVFVFRDSIGENR